MSDTLQEYKLDHLRKQVMLHDIDARSAWELVKFLCNWGVVKSLALQRKKVVDGGFITGEQEKQIIFGERLGRLERLFRASENRPIAKDDGSDVPDALRRDSTKGGL